MVKFDIKNLNIWFDSTQALKDVSMQILANEILSIIGPSNSGKTTFLRMLNRLNDLNPSLKMNGDVCFDGQDIRKVDVELLRRKIGMVFALPLPLPLSSGRVHRSLSERRLRDPASGYNGRPHRQRWWCKHAPGAA